MANGYKTTDLPTTTVADEFLVNRNGGTARLSYAALGAQLDASGPIALQSARIDQLEAEWVAREATLSGIMPTLDAATPAGKALFTAADAAAQLTLLGASAAGQALIAAADPSAQLTLLATPCLIVQDVKTGDGGTFTQGAWRTRDLNTVQSNTIPGAVLASNRITLPSGTYRVHAIAPAYRVQGNKIRLQQITPSAATLLEGTAAYSGDVAYNAFSVSQIVGRITLAATATIELQHWGNNTTSGNGFGSSAPTGSSIYSQIMIERIGNA